MKVFFHHLYEYRKGLRSMVLHTLPGSRRDGVEAKLAAEGIAYVVHELRNGNMNVFFGDEEFVAVVKAIGKENLSQYTPEEDFILGTMLGYARREQCIRYIRMRNRCGDGDNETRGSSSEELDASPPVWARTA